MADQDGNQAGHLTDILLGDVRKVDFFLLVRSLQSQFPFDFPGVGSAVRLHHEPLRFGQPPFLEFAPSAVESVRARKWTNVHSDANAPAAEPGDSDGTPSGVSIRKINQYFFGLFGPNGPLPLHLTEYAMRRWRHEKDPVLMEFADIFHHRMISFFFRAWAEPRMEVDFDRGLSSSRFSQYVGSLAGLHPDQEDRDSIGRMAKLHYIGHLSRQVRNEEGLADLLGDYFQVRVQVQTFQGCWIELPESNRWRLGVAKGAGELGETVILGSTVWDCQMSIRFRFGPLPLKDVLRFLPGTRSFQRLRDWVRLYCDQPFFWDLQLVVRKEQVKPLQLGIEPGDSPGDPMNSTGCGARLGWTSWLTSQPRASDPDDIVIQGEW